MRFRLRPNDDHVHALGAVWVPDPPAVVDPAMRLAAERELRGLLSDRVALLDAIVNGVELDPANPRYT